MSGMELIVRPFVEGNIRPDNKRVNEEPITPVAYVELKFGGPGPNVFAVSASFSPTQLIEDKRTEVTRTFDVVRVKNPEDDSQYIETEVLRAFRLRNQPVQSTNGSAKNEGYQFAAAPEADNIEIIKKNQKRDSSS